MPTQPDLVSCPDCGQPNFLPRGLKAHRGSKTCLARQTETQVSGLPQSRNEAGLCRPTPFKSQVSSSPLPQLPAASTASDAVSTELTIIAPGTLIQERGTAALRPVVPLHNLYHRNGMMATAQGACWLVLAGVELLRQREAIPHGEWEKWVSSNCEYTSRTARNYIALAEGVQNKFLKGLKSNRKPVSDLGDFLQLLETPAQSLTNEQQISLLKAVHKLTNGATIHQLYLDFEIIKKPPVGAGGWKGGGSDSDEEIPLDPPGPHWHPDEWAIYRATSEECRAAMDNWIPTIRHLENAGMTDRTWAELPDLMLRKLKGLLIDLNKLVPNK